MSATVEAGPGRGAATVRWILCCGAVLAVHVGVALLLLRHGVAPDGQPAGAPTSDAIALDMAAEAAHPTPAATPPSRPQRPEPPSPPTPTAPAPEQQPIPAPEPPPPVPIPLSPEHSTPAPEVNVPPPSEVAPDLPEPPPPAPPPPRPAMRSVKHPSPRARSAPPRPSMPSRETARAADPSQASAPSARASSQAAPSATAASAVASWRGALIQRLQQAKRYPEAARARDEQGVATVQFTMDRNGHVVSTNLVHSSGSDLLDQEAVAMFRRAEPLPSLPAGVATDTLTLTVPVKFALQ